MKFSIKSVRSKLSSSPSSSTVSSPASKKPATPGNPKAPAAPATATKTTTAAESPAISTVESSPSGKSASTAPTEAAEDAKAKPVKRIDQLVKEILPYREKLVDHKVYGSVNSVEELRLFMWTHIFAVWDFMSLLKYLQIELTCVKVPWIPVGNPHVRYLINEIVTDEESDVDETGERMSHFELYLLAMKKAGAETDRVEEFVKLIKQGESVESALEKIDANEWVKAFVGNTMSTIALEKPHVAAAVFTFGREDLIPGMFISFVRQLHKDDPDKFSIFKYYLERHIEVDGDHHSILAHEMTSILCGDDEDKWQEATEAVKRALSARISLWDGILAQLEQAR